MIEFCIFTFPDFFHYFHAFFPFSPFLYFYFTIWCVYQIRTPTHSLEFPGRVWEVDWLTSQTRPSNCCRRKIFLANRNLFQISNTFAGSIAGFVSFKFMSSSAVHLTSTLSKFSFSFKLRSRSNCSASMRCCSWISFWMPTKKSSRLQSLNRSGTLRKLNSSA